MAVRLRISICGWSSGMRKQDRLEENLIDTMGRLWRRPIAVGSCRVGESVAPARNWNARQLLAGEGRAVADVVRVQQAGLRCATFRRCRDGGKISIVRAATWLPLGLRRLCARARFSHGDLDATPRQIDREA